MTLDFKGSAFEWLTFKTNLKMTSQENQLYQPRNIYGFSMGVKDILNIINSEPDLDSMDVEYSKENAKVFSKAYFEPFQLSKEIISE